MLWAPASQFIEEAEKMLRTACAWIVLGVCCASPALAQTNLEAYFTGKEAVAKIDMPGTEKGIDLKFDKPSPMDWNDYSQRLKSFGVAIHKGDVVRITKFNVKKDIIEFQLNGGGFGTVHDDTNTTVTATVIPKTQLEKDLEKQIAATTDPNKKRDLQRDLDKERARRDRENAANQSNAQIASQIKAQQVAQNRLSAGSRINLRWQGSIPSDSLNPDTVMKLLADYVDFNLAPANQAAPAASYPAPAGPPPSNGDAGPASQLKRGMKIAEVTALLGPGKVTSESVSEYGLKTQIIEYTTSESLIDVTSVEGVVVRYSITSK
jgi:hypothetical protein